MARLSTVRFLSAVRAVQAPLCPPPRPVPRRCDAHQGDHKRKKKGDYKGKESEREGQRKRKACPPSLNRSCRRHEVGRGEEKWSPPSTWLLSPRSQLPQELPELCLRHLTHCVLLSRHPPSHVSGGEEFKHRPSAPLVCQEVSNFPPVLPLPIFLPHLRPQGLLLGLPLRTRLEEVLPSLVRVPGCFTRTVMVTATCTG